MGNEEQKARKTTSQKKTKTLGNVGVREKLLEER